MSPALFPKNLIRSIFSMALILVVCILVYVEYSDGMTVRSFSKESDFRVEHISPALLADVNAVIRLNETHFTVYNKKEALRKNRLIVTILNKKGMDYAEFYVLYDKFQSVKSMQGSIRNARGKIIRKLKKNDIKDYSAIDGFTLFDNNRIKYAELMHHEFPYTIDIEYEIYINGLINWPSFFPFSRDASVEHAQFLINFPSDVGMRFHNQNFETQYKIIRESNRTTYQWTFSDLSPCLIEPHGLDESDQMPAIRTAPHLFQFEQYPGDMSSWEAFGAWYAGLNKGRATLPQKAIDEINKMVLDADTDLLKVKRLYAYLQNNTRYVSVQLGIGGWQPFPASTVYENGYGDCKALVNYMQAMLNQAGIESYQVLTKRQNNFSDIILDFPSNQFNHVILMVPLDADSLWLECTDKTIPFGHLGADNEDRHALLIAGNGGKIIKTPKSKALDNQQIRLVHLGLHQDGSAEAAVRLSFTGNQQDRVRRSLLNKSPRDQDKWLRSRLNVSSFRLIKSVIHDMNMDERSISMDLDLYLPGFYSRSGNRLFINPNAFSDAISIPPESAERRHAVMIDYPKCNVDSVWIKIPENYIVEAKPDIIQVETVFGNFSAHYTLIEPAAILYVRKLEYLNRVIPETLFAEYREFLLAVHQSDNKRLVLLMN